MAEHARIPDPRAAEVLEFWFGAPGDAQHGRPREQWFVKRPEFDDAIRRRFGALIEEALAGGCEDWLDTPESALACVIVLDQFTRNAWRDSARAFAGDPLALRAATAIVERGWDRGFAPVQRWFCYLPFEHSERLADQERAVELFAALRDDPDSASAWDYALRHRDVIRRFGRFPHRNAALGRASTPQEEEFLRQPGSRF